MKYIYPPGQDPSNMDCDSSILDSESSNSSIKDFYIADVYIGSGLEKIVIDRMASAVNHNVEILFTAIPDWDDYISDAASAAAQLPTICLTSSQILSA